MPRRPKTDQLDLFAHPHDAKTAQMPHWHALPAEARLALTRLMVCLILDHATGERAAERKEVGHDL